MGKPKEIDIDAELAKFEAEERARLGLETEKEHWTDGMTERRCSPRVSVRRPRFCSVV